MTGGELSTLLRRMQEGDDTAFECLYKSMYKPVCSVTYAVVGDYQLAEDAAQEAFITIYRKCCQYQRDENPSAWIFTIAHNTAVNMMRKLGRETSAPQMSLSDANISLNDSPMEQLEEADLLDTMFAVLSETDRKIVIYHLVAGLKHRETADILGLPLGTVLRRYHMALKKMKQVTKGGGEDEKMEETFSKAAD